ncbi:MAG: hypothetical protein KF901_15745 [Myxococcales bacterium]|nr:hypothetical protein [Myxococcales bacterium]
MSASEASLLLAVGGLPEELQGWVASRPFDEAWEGCGRPEWLVALATSAGVDRFALVAVICDVIERARLATELPEAFQLAKGWTRGQVDGRACWAAGFRAMELARRAPDARVRVAARAAAAAAFACDADADEGYYASRGHAVEAVQIAASGLDANERSLLASHVRRRISAESVLRGLKGIAERRSSVPPPGGESDGGVHVASVHARLASSDDAHRPY